VFVGGVDEAVEVFGGVGADGQHADVVDDDQIDAVSSAMALVIESSARRPQHSEELTT